MYLQEQICVPEIHNASCTVEFITCNFYICAWCNQPTKNEEPICAECHLKYKYGYLWPLYSLIDKIKPHHYHHLPPALQSQAEKAKREYEKHI